MRLAQLTMGDKYPIDRSYHHVVHAANWAGKPDDAGGTSTNRRVGISCIYDAALAGTPPTWRLSKHFNDWRAYWCHDGTCNRMDAICTYDTKNSDERYDLRKLSFTPRRLRTGATEVAEPPLYESATRDSR